MLDLSCPLVANNLKPQNNKSALQVGVQVLAARFWVFRSKRCLVSRWCAQCGRCARLWVRGVWSRSPAPIVRRLLRLRRRDEPSDFQFFVGVVVFGFVFDFGVFAQHRVEVARFAVAFAQRFGCGHRRTARRDSFRVVYRGWFSKIIEHHFCDMGSKRWRSSKLTKTKRLSRL